MPPKKTTGRVIEALFDVRPKQISGGFDFAKNSRLATQINLRKEIEIPVQPRTATDSRHLIQKEFEEALALPAEDAMVELVKAGGQVHSLRQHRPSAEIAHVFDAPRLWQSPVAEIATLATRWEILNEKATSGIGTLGSGMRSELSSINGEMEAVLALIKKDKNYLSGKKTKKGINKKYSILAVSVICLITVIGWRGGLFLKDKIVTGGTSAVANLEQAKNDLADMNFGKAADNFALAYDDFAKTSSTLNELGANFLSVFSGIPGLSQMKSASNLAEAGKSIAKSGEYLALAVNTFSKIDLAKEAPLNRLVGEFKDVLVFADKNINQANNLLADVDPNDLPEDKRALLLNFKEKIPEFQNYIGEAIDYTDFLSGVIGSDGTKRYLVLLQNNNELRATGGFPGTYALVTFTNGKLIDIKVDDVYNLDGQIRENIIPPKPLQHITPNWGMRDANWFADFPTSSKKIEEMYLKDGGQPVDGVLTITPDIIEKLMAIVGPIDMPEYGLTLNADNLVTELQKEVEYGDNRSQPKTIVKELEPKLFAKIASQDKDGWLKIFKVAVEAVAQKHVLAFLNDSKLQKIAIEKGVGGEIKSTHGDYIQVVFSNIKGSKTDALTDNSFDLQIKDNQNELNHSLTITRTHQGGDSKFGFYNKVNTSYVRVYLPKGSQFKNIEGQSVVNYQPLINHADYNFKTDPDLAKINSSQSSPASGVDVFEESGKTVIGFWLNTKPKETKTVVLNYTNNQELNPDYSLLWQKQSGTSAIPVSITLSEQTLYSGDLAVDRTVKAR